MRRLTGIVVMVAGALAACALSGPAAEVAIDRPPADRDRAEPLTLEEAGLLASRALTEIYGLDADPVPVQVEGVPDTLGRQTMWRLDLRVDVTVDGERVEHGWEMWVGTSDAEDAAVLRAVRADP